MIISTKDFSITVHNPETQRKILDLIAGVNQTQEHLSPLSQMLGQVIYPSERKGNK